MWKCGGASAGYALPLRSAGTMGSSLACSRRYCARAHTQHALPPGQAVDSNLDPPRFSPLDARRAPSWPMRRGLARVAGWPRTAALVCSRWAHVRPFQTEWGHSHRSVRVQPPSLFSRSTPLRLIDWCDPPALEPDACCRVRSAPKAYCLMPPRDPRVSRSVASVVLVAAMPTGLTFSGHSNEG